ncbi:MAG: radical SAM family heme chaperone HemW [Candidatus Marinimicrobia bacterium]|nr:radical SAM family heme chaperone HemW [Candidatus Neomarinimicrobiota bacterium]
MVNSSSKQKTGIYIHYPFCLSKCIHCDFYSLPLGRDTRSIEKKYIYALLDEIRLYRSILSVREPSTIYLGGGSPNLLSIRDLHSILDCICEVTGVARPVEFSIEINPASDIGDKLEGYKALGVNRISIGVQSFSNEMLKFLRRPHSVEDSLETYKMLRDWGFENINMDLIFGFPMQTLDEFKRDLETVVDLGPEHISVYNLIYERDTPLYRMRQTGKVEALDEDVEWQMWVYMHKFLEDSGYTHYEVSNFAIDGKESVHNLNYWNRKEYFGFGPSAHSFSNGIRWWNVRDLGAYIGKVEEREFPMERKEVIEKKDQIEEVFMLSMRVKDGVRKESIEKIAAWGNELFVEVVRGLEKYTPDYLSLSKDEIVVNYKGWFILDEILVNVFHILDAFWREIYDSQENS